MRNILLLISVLLFSWCNIKNVLGNSSSDDIKWIPIIRSAPLTVAIPIIDGRALMFHFEYPTENNFIQIYDQSGQLIFEDCFSTLSSPDYQISLEDFSVGCYTVYYSDSNGQMSGFLTIDE